MQQNDVLIPLGFVGMVSGMVLVYRLGLRLSEKWSTFRGWKTDIFGAIETSTLGLYALLLGFTFSFTLNRHDDRRKIIIEEVGTIQSAILLTDLYDDSNRTAFRKDLQDYLEARIKYFEAGRNDRLLQESMSRTASSFYLVWNRATALSKLSGYLVPSNQMIPSLVRMINIVNTRDSLMYSRLSRIIVVILYLMVLFSSFLMGIASKDIRPHLFRFVGFVLVSISALVLIVDMNRPEAGLIKLEKAENKMILLREMFKP